MQYWAEHIVEKCPENFVDGRYDRRTDWQTDGYETYSLRQLHW
jgi:hypothetical protein